VHVAGSDGTHDLRATNVVIATGSRPRSLPGLELNGTTVISSDHALELTELPESIIILGAGAVGVEWASLFDVFGVAVTVVEIMPTLVPLEDKDIGRELGRSFSRRGITVKTNAKLLVDTLQAAADSVAVEIEVEGERESLQADLLLVAVGRTGNVEELGLDAVGVSTESGVIPIDEYGRTNVPHVYAIGDVAGGYLLAHKATAEGHIVVEHLAGEETHPLDPLRVPRATYCRPEIASVGLLEEEAAAQGREVKVGRFPFAALGKALIKGKTEGFVKMVCDATTDEILGTHVIGPNATDIVAEMGLAQLLEATPLEVGLNVHPHPTLAEAIMEASWDVDRRAVHVFRRR
ncbi:MAG: FAD-dependent oxidoreductase, partial [Chloroflexota bacterium]|nr:FAD-dependent oxidoreductase [Chloroflexota bacterium]